MFGELNDVDKADCMSSFQKGHIAGAKMNEMRALLAPIKLAEKVNHADKPPVLV